MFEASINRQFKSRFAALNGAVHMGPISVLRRIFNGHSIDGYVLSDNLGEQLVVMKKREFESLCKYIKVDIERTSNIPRAKLIKERNLKGIDMYNRGMIDPQSLLPYKDVTCGEYSRYLNGAYLEKIQPWQHLVLNGMNFSHYEVIFKAMQSNMANAINQAYDKYGNNINGVLSKRSYNAEEYEVALLAVAYMGIDESNPDYLRVVCANDGSGARAMKSKLDKYKGLNQNKVEKIDKNKENIQKEQKNIEGIENAYIPWVEYNKGVWANVKYSTNPQGIPYAIVSLYIDSNAEDEPDIMEGLVDIYIYRVGKLPNFKIIMSMDGPKKESSFYREISCNKDESIYDIQSKLTKTYNSFYNLVKKEKRKELSKEWNSAYSLNYRFWFKDFLEKYPNLFDDIACKKDGRIFFNYTCNDTIYEIGFIDTKVIRSANPVFFGRDCLTFTHSGPTILQGHPRSQYEGLSEQDMDNLLFQRINEIVSSVESSKIRAQQKLDEQRIKMEQSKYASEYRRGYHQDAPPKTIFDNEDPSYF